VESTVRFAAELGYDVTLVKDATADYGEEFIWRTRWPRMDIG
jgi:nicotinamidase-related amidase